MRPEAKSALDRAVRRHRLKQGVIAVGLVSPVLALLLFFLVPPVHEGVALARFVGLGNTPSDDANQVHVRFEIDGERRSLRAQPGDAFLSPGDVFCVSVLHHRFTGARLYDRAPASRCD